MATDLNNDGYADGILSTLVDDSSGMRNPIYRFSQGTSMASPHVAGILALMRAVHPGISPDDIDNLLSAGTITSDIGAAGRDDLYGYGFIDALKSVQAAQKLANGGTLPPQPALITSSPNQLTMKLTNSSVLDISNQGEAVSSITTYGSNASWLSINATNVNALGLGEYTVTVDRSGLPGGSYIGVVTFSIANGEILEVPVSMLVGSVSTIGSAGYIYALLIDDNGNTVAIDPKLPLGNGVYSYSFTGVPPGSYRIIAGSDIDNDSQVCQLGESCGGYPTIDSLSSVDVVNTDLTNLNFVIDILSGVGSSDHSAESNNSAHGYRR